ncbi:MAG: hypothetical protein H7A25_22240 [Leptospiraceae bacterium]|nr:hypothetical protein [Leptospiraceae bacterium]
MKREFFKINDNFTAWQSNSAQGGYVRLRANNLYTKSEPVEDDPSEVRLQEAIPKNENAESIIVPFRMLTASLIEGHWLDFTEKGLLEKSVDKFKNVTIYTDHYTSVDNWVGVALNAHFIKDGIDADFKIDSVKAPMIARGLTIQPPAIHSCSVGIFFEAEMSHPQFKRWEFWDRLGEEIDGEIVRFIVKKIVEVPEVSLVYSGADPRARRSFIKDLELESMTKEEQFNKLCTALGIKEDDDLEKLIPELKEKLGMSEKILEEMRSETLKTYRAFAQDKARESTVRLIESADFSTLEGLKNEYAAMLEERFPKNQNGNRQSSETEIPPGTTVREEFVNFENYSI